MKEQDFERLHAALDERVIGFTASSDRECTSFDGVPMVCGSENALKKQIGQYCDGGKYEIEPIVYAAIIGSLHEEGVSFLLDQEALSSFLAAKAEDHRLVPADVHWTTELGTLVQPLFNPFSDSATLLQEQVEEVVVGYYHPDDLSGTHRTVPLIAGKARTPNTEVAIPLTWNEYAQFTKFGFTFKPDIISGRLIEDCSRTMRLCEVLLEWDEAS